MKIKIWAIFITSPIWLPFVIAWYWFVDIYEIITSK